MKRLSFRTAVVLCALVVPLAAAADTCIGSCGSSGADGVVTAPPGSDTYTWVSTNAGVDGGGTLNPGSTDTAGSTNGSRLITDPFFAAAGQEVKFNFNYVTSDGSGFADYGWAQLQGAETITLFTARTRPSGSIVPGTNLPGVTATLSPSSVPITAGPPIWSPLGGNSGGCYAAGCGYTGWVQSTYTIETSGTYRLAFGVSNWNDTIFQSGMAFNGLLLGDSTIGNGSSSNNPLLPANLGPNGEFIFEFTPTPNVPIFIDPVVALGYDYEITGGGNSILKALFPVLAGDADGYEIYTLGGALLGTVMGGDEFSFGAGVTGFSLRGIDAAAGVDPSNPTGFVTGLWFATSDLVTMTQTPTPLLAVPEPQSWAMFAAGLLLCAWRQRRLS